MLNVLFVAAELIYTRKSRAIGAARNATAKFLLVFL